MNEVWNEMNKGTLQYMVDLARRFSFGTTTSPSSPLSAYLSVCLSIYPSTYLPDITSCLINLTEEWMNLFLNNYNKTKVTNQQYVCLHKHLHCPHHHKFHIVFYYGIENFYSESIIFEFQKIKLFCMLKCIIWHAKI